MKRLLIFILLLISGSAIGQKLYFRADSSLFYRVGGSNELIIENSTKGITGVLVNYGNGRTRFSKPRIVGDTLFVGVDTILGVGSGSGSPNSNVGSAFRLAIPNTNNIKTLGNRYGISLDSSTSNQIGIGLDSSTVFPHIRATVPSRRFGVIGEDDVATQNRDFDGNGNDFLITGASSMTLQSNTASSIEGSTSAQIVGGTSEITLDNTGINIIGELYGFSNKYNNQTGTSYTLQSSDNGKIVTLSNAGAITLTVPSGLPAGFNCTIVQLGAGVATVTPSSTTVNNADSFTQSGGQYSAFTILQYATNTFLTQGKMQ